MIHFTHTSHGTVRSRIFPALRAGTIAALLLAGTVIQARADAYTDYIEKYGEMAVAEQERSGIPASITLAQGLLESAAGRSTLAREGNNHFGIKCHTDWEGATMLRSDDAPDECFRVYDDASQSFADHTRFLQRKRYARLFDLDHGDYAGWARGLKECGYATDPHYADRLITIIERYGLASYDNGISGVSSEMADFISRTLASTHAVRRTSELHYVVALPGDTYTSIASELGTDAGELARYNDADSPDCEIRAWQEVYLQPKRDAVPDSGPKRATIGVDETMHSISQRYGITMHGLRTLNPKAKDCPGTRLRLR